MCELNANHSVVFHKCDHEFVLLCKQLHRVKCTGLLSERRMWPVISAQQPGEDDMCVCLCRGNEMIKHVFPWRKCSADCSVIPSLVGCVFICQCVFVYMCICLMCMLEGVTVYKTGGGTAAFALLLRGGIEIETHELENPLKFSG